MGVFLFISPVLHADEPEHTPQTYLTKYLTYVHWVEHLPTTIDPEFIQFIEPTTPLTQKLRNKWLYQLAKQQDWTHFHQYYRPTDDRALQCHEQTALYHLGQTQEALQGALPLWLSAQSQPLSCTTLFGLLLKNHLLTQAHIDQRITLSLAKNQGALALYLLKQSGSAREKEANALNQIAHDPKRIVLLQPGQLSGDLYLYGLKLVVSRNSKAAITLWHHPQTSRLLNGDQKQQFLAYLALYKAMRHQEDAELWFAQVSPKYRDPTLRDWEIRYALMHQKWHKILQLTTDATTNQPEPNWQYWHARALDALGRHQEALQHYQLLAQKRSYYGFLASVRSHQALHFESEPANQDLQSIAVYAPVLDKIAQLYHAKQGWLAARTLNEFSSELPKSEKSALTYWVAAHLHWPGKAIYLSSSDEALFHQLTLRFPLTYRQVIQTYAKAYHMPEALVYAIIRQESTFFEDITSQAGACGLMQILPRTAKIIAKQAKIAYSNDKELFSSTTNIHLGIAYLNMLSQPFHGHPLLMAAAYNAGPKQVQHWLKNHPPKDIDIWIETLPWQETRNYLKNVMAFYAVYQYRMQQTPNLDAFLQPFASKENNRSFGTPKKAV
ncbi:MAG: lytic murein transglycosylase [Legionella sp.]|nr:MAG: lytic murein transglycosylase [Legionella sp.]